jgi:6-phosphogluconolactonase
MTAKVMKHAGLDALSRAAAVEFAAIANATRGPCHIALSGGTTPKRLFEVLVKMGKSALPWDRIELWWGDERCVPPDHPDSNFGMTKAALIDPLGLTKFHRIEAEHDPAIAARDYERTLVASLGEPPVFDLVWLGMGPDGHTASLFPGSPALRETELTIANSDAIQDSGHPPRARPPGTRYVVANLVRSPLVPGGQATRITMTYPTLNAARHTRFLVAGADKAATLQAVLSGPRDRYPSQGITGADVVWLVDEAAGGGLP